MSSGDSQSQSGKKSGATKWCNQVSWAIVESTRPGGHVMGSLLKVWVVRHVDAEGRRVSRDTPGSRAIKEKSAKWYGQFKDAAGNRRRVPLCTDKAAALQELARLER